MARRITNAVRDSNAYASWVERFVQIGALLGFTGVIQAFAWSVLLTLSALLVWLRENVPWWVGVLAGLLFASLSLYLFNGIKVARSIRGLKAFDLPTFADECMRFYRDYSEAAVTHQRTYVPSCSDRDDTQRQWAERVQHSNRVDALMMQRFAGRAYALAHQMKSIGIRPPNMFFFSVHDAAGAAVYIGMVGELLSKGLLEEARKLDPQVTWGATIR